MAAGQRTRTPILSESPLSGAVAAPGPGRCDRAGNAGDLLSARAATLFIKGGQGPLEPVASSLVLRQQFSPAWPGWVEPVIRTLTPGDGRGMANRPGRPLAGSCPARRPLHEAGRRAATERFVAEGRFASSASGARPRPPTRAGRYMLAPRPCAGSTPRAVASRRCACPHILWCSRQGRAPLPPPRTRGPVSLLGAPWPSSAGISCATGRAGAPSIACNGPLATGSPGRGQGNPADLGRPALAPCLHLARLPCHRDPCRWGRCWTTWIGPVFPKQSPLANTLPGQALAREFSTWESFATAYGLRNTGVDAMHDAPS